MWSAAVLPPLLRITMKGFTSRRALLIVISAIFFLCAIFCSESNAANPCDISILPREIQTKLEKNYPDWQPEKLKNLYEDDRHFWTEAHPNDCPGIAIGHFESKTEFSYALLLVSKPERKRPGLRILVFSRLGPSAEYILRVISRYDTGDFYEGSDQVIATVPAGHYEEAQGPKRVDVDLDGISYEVMEKGAILYYWRNGRYHELVTSD
jgi:hypothetical protein